MENDKYISWLDKWWREIGCPRRVAVLCPGISITSTPDDYDAYIGVNRAVMYRECQMLSAFNSWQWHHLNVDIRDDWMPILTTEQCYKELINLGLDRYLHPPILSNNIRGQAHGLDIVINSATAPPLLLANMAHYLKIHIDVDIWGMNMRESTDWDGYKLRINQRNRRPANYARTLRGIRDIAKLKCISLRRMK